MFKPVGSDFIHTVSQIPKYTHSYNILMQLLITQCHMCRLSWKIQRYLFAEKILTNATDFLMTFGGSSVTAGHDNQYNQVSVSQS